jgi:hypothetical protein
MRRRTLALTTITFAGALLVSVPSPARAATGQFGNPCVAVNSEPNVTFVLTGLVPGSANPAAAPFAGVITKATFNVPGAAPTPISQTLKVMHPTGAADTYKVTAQSASLPVPNTSSSFNVRMPVAAGDLLGLTGGVNGTIYCSSANAADTVARIAGDQTLGSTATYTSTTGMSLPVVATVEPDADGDGYGDVTQDLCPQNAAFQVACPVIKLDSLASPSGGGKISLIVTSSTAAKVSVSGLAKVNGKKVKLKGGSKQLPAGSLTQFKVKLPRALKSALAKLPPSQKITVTITVSATNVAGTVFTDTTKVKLPGTK